MKTLCSVFTVVGVLALSFQSLQSGAHADEMGDMASVQACLGHWGKTPFNKKSPVFKTLSAKVKVLGIGGETKDEVPTEKPALVLIKPNVTVLSKATLSLLNPNGWYCLKGQVAVLGASKINLNCAAHLASSADGATVMGGGDQENHGVTVLGSTNVNLTGNCSKKSADESN